MSAQIPSMIATNSLWSWIYIYRCQAKDVFACGETLIKKHRAAATLISSHESRNQITTPSKNAF